MITKKEIFIHLLNEGVDGVWRPTQAEQIEDDIFKVLPTDNYDPEDEEWEFIPGSLVRCESRELSKGRRLVAVEKVE